MVSMAIFGSVLEGEVVSDGCIMCERKVEERNDDLV